MYTENQVAEALRTAGMHEPWASWIASSVAGRIPEGRLGDFAREYAKSRDTEAAFAAVAEEAISAEEASQPLLRRRWSPIKATILWFRARRARLHREAVKSFNA